MSSLVIIAIMMATMCICDVACRHKYFKKGTLDGSQDINVGVPYEVEDVFSRGQCSFMVNRGENVKTL